MLERSEGLEDSTRHHLQEGERSKGKKTRKENMKQKGTNETTDKMKRDPVFFPAILSTAVIRRRK